MTEQNPPVPPVDLGTTDTWNPSPELGGEAPEFTTPPPVELDTPNPVDGIPNPDDTPDPQDTLSPDLQDAVLVQNNQMQEEDEEEDEEEEEQEQPQQQSQE
jgi:hypothetical protein